MNKGFSICVKNSGGEWVESSHIDEYQLESVLHSAELEGYSDVAVMNESIARYEVYHKKDGKWVHSISGNSGFGIAKVCESSDRTHESAILNEVLDRIYLKNTDKFFCESNSLNESPEVGLFWIDKKNAKVYGDGVPIRDAELFGRGTKDQFAVHPSTHMDIFRSIKSLNPKWKNINDYEDIPRGRSIFKYEPNNNHFIVFMSPEVKGEKYENAVKSFFSLPWNTEFKYDDDHYQPID